MNVNIFRILGPPGFALYTSHTCKHNIRWVMSKMLCMVVSCYSLISMKNNTLILLNPEGWGLIIVFSILLLIRKLILRCHSLEKVLYMMNLKELTMLYTFNITGCLAILIGR